MWCIENDDKLGGVTCIKHFDINDDDVEELIVGRDDGVVQIYSYDSFSKPSVIYKTVDGFELIIKKGTILFCNF